MSTCIQVPQSCLAETVMVIGPDLSGWKLTEARLWAMLRDEESIQARPRGHSQIDDTSLCMMLLLYIFLINPRQVSPFAYPLPLSCDAHHLFHSRQDWKDNSLALAEAKKARLVIRAVSRVQSFSSTPGTKTFGSSPGKKLAPPPLGRSSLPGKLAPPPGGSGAGASTAARRRCVLFCVGVCCFVTPLVCGKSRNDDGCLAS